MILRDFRKRSLWLGAFVAVLWAFLLCCAVWPAVSWIPERADPPEFIVWIATLVSATICVFAILSAIQFARNPVFEWFLPIIGWNCALGGFVLALRIKMILSGQGSEDRFNWAVIPIALVIGTGAHLAAMRWLGPWFGIAWRGIRNVLGRGVFLLAAWQIWQLSFHYLREALKPHVHSSLLGLLILVLPIVFALVFYKLAMRWLESPPSVR